MPTYLHWSRWRSETNWNIGTPMGRYKRIKCGYIVCKFREVRYNKSGDPVAHTLLM